MDRPWRTAYKKLVKAVAGTTDKKVKTALADFEALFFNNMIPVLDRPFVQSFQSEWKECSLVQIHR